MTGQETTAGTHGIQIGYVCENMACIRSGRLLFQDLGFTLKRGDVLFLTGPNGIGKSSLLRILAGFLPPAQGICGFEGRDAGIAYLGHGDGLKPLLTVSETMAFWAALSPGTGPKGQTYDDFGLIPIADLPCRYLSAGQRRRLALARTAATGAGLWLLDEPTTSLDEAGGRAFEMVLERHRKDGGMAVIATHNAIAAEGAETLELARFSIADDDPFYRGQGTDISV